MSSIVPICSWCGIKLNHDEMYVGTSDFIQKQKIKDAWTEVLDKKQLSVMTNALEGSTLN